MNHQYSTDSNASDDYCDIASGLCKLKFEPSAIEDVILMISDKIDLKVLMGNEKMAGAAMITAGMAFAGGLLGRHLGGKTGAVMGGAVGGALGVGVSAIAMRDLWEEVKYKLSELYEIVFDYLAGMGIEDYRKAAQFIAKGTFDHSGLAMIIMQNVGEVLGKKCLSNLC